MPLLFWSAIKGLKKTLQKEWVASSFPFFRHPTERAWVFQRYQEHFLKQKCFRISRWFRILWCLWVHLQSSYIKTWPPMHLVLRSPPHVLSSTVSKLYFFQNWSSAVGWNSSINFLLSIETKWQTIGYFLLGWFVDHPNLVSFTITKEKNLLHQSGQWHY